MGFHKYLYVYELFVDLTDNCLNWFIAQISGLSAIKIT